MSTYYVLGTVFHIPYLFDCPNILVRLTLLLPYPFYRAGKLRLSEGKGIIQRVRSKRGQPGGRHSSCKDSEVGLDDGAQI